MRRIIRAIKADYVSASVFRYLDIPIPEALPPWTATSLEWASITVSYILRSVLIAANLVILSVLYRKVRKLPDTGSKQALPDHAPKRTRRERRR